MEDILSEITHRKALKTDGKDSKAQTRSPNRKLSKAVSATCMSSGPSSLKKKQKQETVTNKAPKRRAEKDEELIIQAKKKQTDNLAKDCAGASL